ncbi:hypothetical protein [Dielma fastidiosa]|uniref:hypothetical protein n=1 Tax=Dielma fastidiosa TaxID=1034346 RepID=UPI003568277F
MKKLILSMLTCALLLSGTISINAIEKTNLISNVNNVMPRTNYDWWQYDISVSKDGATQFQGPYSSGYFLIHMIGHSYDYRHKLYIDFGGVYGSVEVAVFIKNGSAWKETTSFTLSGTNQVSKIFDAADRTTGYSDVFKIMLYNNSSKDITLASVGLVTE